MTGELLNVSTLDPLLPTFLIATLCLCILSIITYHSLALTWEVFLAFWWSPLLLDSSTEVVLTLPLTTVFPQVIVVIAMLRTGLLWGWQLTLVGMAIAPVFVITTAVQTNLVFKCKLRNKCAHEHVVNEYYEVSTIPTPCVPHKLICCLGDLQHTPNPCHSVWAVL